MLHFPLRGNLVPQTTVCDKPLPSSGSDPTTTTRTIVFLWLPFPSVQQGGWLLYIFRSGPKFNPRPRCWSTYSLEDVLLLQCSLLIANPGFNLATNVENKHNFKSLIFRGKNLFCVSKGIPQRSNYERITWNRQQWKSSFLKWELEDDRQQMEIMAKHSWR